MKTPLFRKVLRFTILVLTLLVSMILLSTRVIGLVQSDVERSGLDIGTRTLTIASSASSVCVPLIGTGTIIRTAIVPAGFDDANPSDVIKFEQLADAIANGFANIEPYASNLDHISLSRADDYRGRDIDAQSNSIWYNSLLIQAAEACNYNQIIVIAHNSGWAGGAPGYYSVVGSGVPPSCEPTSCTGTGCPWTPSCSWDENIAYTALHETGHTFAGLRHTCFPLSRELQQLKVFERIPDFKAIQDDPINCGVQFSESADLPCAEWNQASYLNWMFPGDPNFGCYAGCDDQSEWYRPWYTNANIMCIDYELANGFSPVDRKMLSDIIGGTAPSCYTLSTNVNPSNGGSISVSPTPNCNNNTQYMSGTLVSLTADANMTYAFSNWSGSIGGEVNSPFNMIMNSGKSVMANFETFTLFLPIIMSLPTPSY